MSDCIFCKIADGEFDSAKIWEDKDFMAFLDILPNTKGATIVISKKHHNSYVFNLPESDYLNLLSAAKKVAKLLEKGLGVYRIAMVMEGMGINHAHIKLYPLYGVKEKFVETVAPEKIFFEKYEGYISTQIGPQIELNKLKEIAQEIKNRAK